MSVDNQTFQRCPHDKENPYTLISRSLIRDKSISPECRWLIIYLLANKDTWRIHMREIINHCHGFIGRDRVYAVVNEAIDAGYMERQKYIEKGLERTRYFVSESPKFKKSLPRPENQDTEDQDTENQDAKGIAIPKDVAKDKDILIKERETAAPPSSFLEKKTKNEIPILEEKGNHVRISLQDLKNLYDEYGTTAVDSSIEEINDYFDATGKKIYKNFAAGIRNWIRRGKKWTVKKQTNKLENSKNISSENDTSEPLWATSDFIKKTFGL